MLCTKEEKELQKSSIKKRLNIAKLQSINYITGKKGYALNYVRGSLVKHFLRPKIDRGTVVRKDLYLSNFYKDPLQMHSFLPRLLILPLPCE